jgi:hypothetical protein
MKNDPFPTDADIVKRLRQIVAEPQKWCSTDVDYVDDAADAIARLTAERDEARRDAERWQADALRLIKERNAAMEERDEARREVCYASTQPPRECAADRGWDCFKKDGK